MILSSLTKPPNHSRFFWGKKKQSKIINPYFICPRIVPSPNPPQKNGGFPPPNWGFNHPPAECCHGMSSPAPPSWDSSCRRHPNRKRRWGPRTTARQNCSEAPGPLSRFFAGRTTGGEIFLGRFFVRHVPWRKPKRSEKQQKNAQMLLKFVASLVCWLIFFGGGKRKRLHKRGAIFTGHIHKVEKCFGPLDDWRAFFFNVFLFEIKIGLVPTKLEAFEPTTQRNPFRPSRNFARRSVEDDGTWWKLQVLPCSNPLGLPFH